MLRTSDKQSLTTVFQSSCKSLHQFENGWCNQRQFFYTSDACDACAQFYFCLFVNFLGKPLFGVLPVRGRVLRPAQMVWSTFLRPKRQFSALGGVRTLVHFLAHIGNVKKQMKKLGPKKCCKVPVWQGGTEDLNQFGQCPYMETTHFRKGLPLPCQPDLVDWTCSCFF